MIALLVALIGLSLIVVVSLIRNQSHGWIWEKVFGIQFAVGRWFGNCFSPAVVLEWKGMHKSGVLLGRQCHPAWAILTIRTRFGMETMIYWRGWFRFDWNSDHIAFRLGAFHDTDFGGFYQYRGWLGNHTSL